MHAFSNILEVSADSPCVGHCTTVLGNNVCRSHLRAFDEITRWVEVSEEEQRTVNRRIANERSLNAGTGRPSGNAPTLSPTLMELLAIRLSPQAGKSLVISLQGRGAIV